METLNTSWCAVPSYCYKTLPSWLDKLDTTIRQLKIENTLTTRGAVTINRGGFDHVAQCVSLHTVQASPCAYTKVTSSSASLHLGLSTGLCGHHWRLPTPRHGLPVFLQRSLLPFTSASCHRPSPLEAEFAHKKRLRRRFTSLLLRHNFTSSVSFDLRAVQGNIICLLSPLILFPHFPPILPSSSPCLQTLERQTTSHTRRRPVCSGLSWRRTPRSSGTTKVRSFFLLLFCPMLSMISSLATLALLFRFYAHPAFSTYTNLCLLKPQSDASFLYRDRRLLWLRLVGECPQSPFPPPQSPKCHHPRSSQAEARPSTPNLRRERFAQRPG